MANRNELLCCLNYEIHLMYVTKGIWRAGFESKTCFVYKLNCDREFISEFRQIFQMIEDKIIFPCFGHKEIKLVSVLFEYLLILGKNCNMLKKIFVHSITWIRIILGHVLKRGKLPKLECLVLLEVHVIFITYASWDIGKTLVQDDWHF